MTSHAYYMAVITAIYKLQNLKGDRTLKYKIFQNLS